MSQNEVRIGVIGAGSMGSLIGGYLASIKSDSYLTKIILFGRKEHVNVINKNGLILQKDDDTTLLIKDNILAFENLENFKDSSNSFDFIFLTTKTYDIQSAMIQYKTIIDITKYLVILQNGIGNEDVVKESCAEEKIIRCVTSNGGLLESPGKVMHTGKGFTKIGIPFQKTKKTMEGVLFLKELLELAGIETEVVEDILGECWDKVFVNIGINAIGALSRLRNGKLLEYQNLKHLMRETIEEALKIAKLKGVSLLQKDHVALSYSIAEKTSNNKNSMLQDILKGKQTEIDFINGRIVEYAEILRKSAPINKMLTSLIKGLEKASL